uniref:Uncharacterized protein n=1 Tax=viral metagenome TaxID=1070528 RepID=A0A6H1ZDH4_9ZZZZ
MIDAIVCREIHVERPFGYFGNIIPVVVRLPGSQPQTAANYTASFFIADRRYEVKSAVARYETAAGGFATADIYRAPSGTTIASGVSVLSTTINLNSATSTNQTIKATNTLKNRIINIGDSLGLVSAGALGATANLTIVIYLKAI